MAGNVNPPNNDPSIRIRGSSDPHARDKVDTPTPNDNPSIRIRGSSDPHARLAPNVSPPNDGIFRDGDPGGSMPQRKAPIQPGQPAIAVDGPRVGMGANGMATSDDAKRNVGKR